MQVSMLQIHMVHIAKSEIMEYVCGHTLDEKLTSYLASYLLIGRGLYSIANFVVT